MRKRSGLRTSPKRLGFLLLLIILVAVFTFPGKIASIISPVSSRLVAFGTSISSSIFTIGTARNLSLEEVRLYEERLEELSLEAAKVEQLRAENEELRALMSFQERREETYVPAHVLSKSFHASASRLLLDVGQDDGVEVGAAVVSESGILLGKVVDVSDGTATVIGATDPQSAIAVSLLNDPRTIGVANGSSSDLLAVEFIPVDEPLSVNDLVVTSGLEQGIPSGLLLGIVNTIEQETGVPFQTAILEPLIDARHVHHVLVLTDTYHIDS